MERKKSLVSAVLIIVLAVVITFAFVLMPKNATDYLYHRFKNDDKFAVSEIIKVEEFGDSTLFVYKTNNGEICFIATTKLLLNSFRISSSALFISKYNKGEPQACYCSVPKKYDDRVKDDVNYFVCAQMNCYDTQAYFNGTKLKTIQIEDNLFAYAMFLNAAKPKELIFTYK